MTRISPPFWLLIFMLLAIFLFTLLNPHQIRANPPTPTDPIDSFEVSQDVLSLTIPEDIEKTVSASVAGSDIWGGERDLAIKLTQGDTDYTVLMAGVASNVFFLNSGAGIAGSAQIVWDGVDNNPSGLNPTGLDGLDLTANGAKHAFELTIRSGDRPFDCIIEVFSDAANSSTFKLSVPGRLAKLTPAFVLPYADFAPKSGAGADFANVGAVTLFIPPTPNLDLEIASLSTVSLLTLTASKDDLLIVDNNGDGQINPGDILEYSVVITTAGDLTATNVLFSDLLDPHTTLITNSVTTTHGTVTTGNNADDVTVEVNLNDLAPNSSVAISFQAAITTTIPPDMSQVVNQGVVIGSNFPEALTDDPETDTALDPTVTLITIPTSAEEN